MIELDLFPTLVIVKTGFIDFETRNRLLNVKTTMFKHPAVSGNGVSSYQMKYDILTNEKELKYKINRELKNCSIKMGIHEQVIYNTWVNTQHEGSSLKFHQHPRSNISGALYLDVNTGCSPLKFLNPNPHIFMQVNKNNTKYNNEYMNIQPENGTLILFPSWLPHGSEINQTTRKVLSFNSRDNG